MDECHCGRPVAGEDEWERPGPAYRFMCEECATVRCDVDPSACPYRGESKMEDRTTAIIGEAQVLLDSIGEGDVTLSSSSDGTAAVIGLLEVVMGQQSMLLQILERAAEAQHLLSKPLDPLDGG